VLVDHRLVGEGVISGDKGSSVRSVEVTTGDSSPRSISMSVSSRLCLARPGLLIRSLDGNKVLVLLLSFPISEEIYRVWFGVSYMVDCQSGDIMQVEGRLQPETGL
jgi:hypothetical protein